MRRCIFIKYSYSCLLFFYSEMIYHLELCIFYKEWVFHCRDLHRVTVLIFPVQDQFDYSKAILIFWSQNRSYSICVVENGCRMIFVCLNRTFCPLILSLGTVSFSFPLSPPGVEHALGLKCWFGEAGIIIFSPKVGWSCASSLFMSLCSLVGWLLGPLILQGSGQSRKGSSYWSSHWAMSLASDLHQSTAAALNIVVVIKVHSPLLPQKHSTPQIPNTTYSPVNFPKHSLFTRFKQGFVSQPGKTPYSRNTQRGECVCASKILLVKTHIPGVRKENHHL